MELKAYYDDVTKCMRCGFCRIYCPVFEQTQRESLSSRARMLIIRGLIEGEVKLGDPVAQRIFMCTGCRACNSKCPAKVRAEDAIRQSKSYLLSRGVEPPENYKLMGRMIVEHGNVVGEGRERRPKILLEAGEKAKSEVLYYAGCLASFKYPQIAENMVGIMRAMNCNFTTLGVDEDCCGGFFSWLGNRDELLRSATRIVHRIEKRGIRKVVTSCPMCYETFNHTYSELFGKLDFEVQHSTEFINEAIQDSKIKLANSTKATIVYQDPCHLGRWSDIYEAPRNVLGNIPRVEIVELQRRRDLARCCGGPIRAAYPELAYGMASRILENAREYEVNKVVTACPTCYHSLYASSWEYEMDVRELTEMVASAMGVASRPAF